MRAKSLPIRDLPIDLLLMSMLLGCGNAGLTPDGSAPIAERGVDAGRGGDGAVYDAPAPDRELPDLDAGRRDASGDERALGDGGRRDAEDVDTGVAPDAGPTTDGGGSPRYASDGPEAVIELTIEVDTGQRRFDEYVALPSSAGPHPVVSLSPGTQQRSAAYVPYSRRLASFGMVVVSHDDFGFIVDTTAHVAALRYVIETWLPAMSADPASPLHGKLDLSRIGLTGHSRGANAALMLVEAASPGTIDAWFGLDVVDSFGNDSPNSRDGLSAVSIPLTFLGASVSGLCSPAEYNFEMLYDRAGSPSTQIIVLGAGHVQLEVPSECDLCGLCAPAGTADSAVVLATAVRYTTAFFARELQGDTLVGPAFEGAGSLEDQALGLITITSK